jgi:hypothetical protein
MESPPSFLKGECCIPRLSLPSQKWTFHLLNFTWARWHFTHETESPWPVHFKHSHWRKRWSRSKFASHYAWRTNGVCECKVDVKVYMDCYMASNGSCFMVTWTIFKNHLLEVGLTTKPGDHDTPNAHNRWFILFYHVWGPAWIKIHWNSIRLREWSHMTSHYTWELVTTLHDFGGVLGQPLNTLFWALTLSWSRLLACVWSRPKSVTLIIPFNASYYSESCSAITSYSRVQFILMKVQYVVWTLWNM